VHGETPLQFDAARQFIQAITAERPHVRLVVTSRNWRTQRYLRATFADDQTLAGPFDIGLVVRRFLQRLQVRHLVLLDGGRSVSAKAIRIATTRRIPVSAVNVGSPAGVSLVLRDLARSVPELVRLCVQDDLVADGLRRMGVPPEAIAVTGCLDLEEGRCAQWPSKTAARKGLGLPVDAPVVAAVDVPSEEESLVLDAFAGARHGHPGLRLFLEPRSADRRQRLRKEIETRGWTPIARLASEPMPEGPWDVLITDSPSDPQILLSLATTVVAGGTFKSEARGAYVAAAISAGAWALVGPHRDFQDVPWRLSAASPLACPVEFADLGGALRSAVRELHPAVPGVTGVSARTHEAISAILPESPELPRVAQNWKVPTWRDKCGSSRIWRSAASALMKKRIDRLEDLRARFAHPQSVLCLGNGPSSEDPRLADLAHDCLIRVNWRWLSRGFLVHPQIVFVGDAATIYKVKGAVFGLWNVSLEYGMLLRHLTTRGPRRMEYFTMERTCPLVRDRQWPARPTNGALMIAAGAALAPERLIIAGVDLYLHPDGRYPGDLLGENQYGRPHTRDTDLDIIRAALADYKGEVLILSDALRTALNAKDEVFGVAR
jgi:3-deoxy-D-manno-octulosonic-acid transferase